MTSRFQVKHVHGITGNLPTYASAKSDQDLAIFDKAVTKNEMGLFWNILYIQISGQMRQFGSDLV